MAKNTPICRPNASSRCSTTHSPPKTKTNCKIGQILVISTNGIRAFSSVSGSTLPFALLVSWSKIGTTYQITTTTNRKLYAPVKTVNHPRENSMRELQKGSQSPMRNGFACAIFVPFYTTPYVLLSSLFGSDQIKHLAHHSGQCGRGKINRFYKFAAGLFTI